MTEASTETSALQGERLVVGGLFAGVGGIEQGFERAGHRTAFLCEWDPMARSVLQHRFPATTCYPDVRELTARVEELPNIDVLSGGFPCQDLSQAGRTKGIEGERSGLVSHMLDLMEALHQRPTPPRWLVIENVANMLRLDGGAAMQYLHETLVSRGYSWAYRLVDSRAFGVPQRRQRVLMVASKVEDPRRVLFADNQPEAPPPKDWDSAGFYWTEGLRGLGWALDAVPTLKGGSGLGIPSPPAVWTPEAPNDEGVSEFGTITVRDGERLQGFPADWTKVSQPDGSDMPLGARWRMVGNAVTVNVAAWLGRRLAAPGEVCIDLVPRIAFKRWPDAAYGNAEGVWHALASKCPISEPMPPLVEYLGDGLRPLSLKAAVGFRERTMRAKLEFVPGFLDALDRYIVANGGSIESVRELSDKRKMAAERRKRAKHASSQGSLFA